MRIPLSLRAPPNFVGTLIQGLWIWLLNGLLKNLGVLKSGLMALRGLLETTCGKICLKALDDVVYLKISRVRFS